MVAYRLPTIILHTTNVTSYEKDRERPDWEQRLK
jgi:hypothetical protein